MVSSQCPDVASIEEKPSARSRKSYQSTSIVTLIERGRSNHKKKLRHLALARARHGGSRLVDTQETVKAQPVQSTEALVAAVRFGAAAARCLRLRASYGVLCTQSPRRAPRRRPRVRHPRDRHRQVRLLLGDRRAVSTLERSPARRVTTQRLLHKKLVPGRARQPQPQRVHGGALSHSVVLPDDHRPRQRPLDGASM